ncbi:MAG: hypothetical protein IPO65_20845 [Saprospiraceae bacterium]|nr:hypothetical protein [Saprospiraceae bacterium]
MKFVKIIFVLLVPILILVYTLPLLDLYLNPLPVYKYQSTDGNFEFACYPSKGRDYMAMEKARWEYEEKNKVKLTLCRKFKMKPLHFGNGIDM